MSANGIIDTTAEIHHDAPRVLTIGGAIVPPKGSTQLFHSFERAADVVGIELEGVSLVRLAVGDLIVEDAKGKTFHELFPDDRLPVPQNAYLILVVENLGAEAVVPRALVSLENERETVGREIPRTVPTLSTAPREPILSLEPEETTTSDMATEVDIIMHRTVLERMQAFVQRGQRLTMKEIPAVARALRTQGPFTVREGSGEVVVTIRAYLRDRLLDILARGGSLTDRERMALSTCLMPKTSSTSSEPEVEQSVAAPAAVAREEKVTP